MKNDDEKDSKTPVSATDLALIRLNAALKYDGIKTPTDMLTVQAQALHNLFGFMLSHSVTNKSVDLPGVAVALRSQKQCRSTVETADAMAERRAKNRRTDY